MTTRNVIVKHIALGPLAQWGFIIGGVIACLPAFFCSWLGFTVIQAVRNMLTGLRDVVIDPNFLNLHLNLVDLLHLQNQQQSVNTVAGFGVLGIALVGLGLVFLFGIFGALVTTLLGVFYNATGRVQLELEEVPATVGNR